MRTATIIILKFHFSSILNANYSNFEELYLIDAAFFYATKLNTLQQFSILNLNL